MFDILGVQFCDYLAMFPLPYEIPAANTTSRSSRRAAPYLAAPLTLAQHARLCRLVLLAQRGSVHTLAACWLAGVSLPRLRELERQRVPVHPVLFMGIYVVVVAVCLALIVGAALLFDRVGAPGVGVILAGAGALALWLNVRWMLAGKALLEYTTKLGGIPPLFLARAKKKQ
jgi:hypothetical protein